MFGTPEFQVKAAVDANDDLAVKVTASCSYGSRSASRSVDVTLDDKDADKIKAILKKAVESATVEVVVRSNEKDDKGKLLVDGDGKPLKKVRQVPLGQKVFSDAAESLTIATNNGEEV